MFSRLGNAVARNWILVIAAWITLVGGLKLAQFAGLAPRWNDVTYDGDLAHLPAEMTSVRGARLLGQAFPEDRAKSQIVLVIARPDQRLDAADREFSGRLASVFREKQEKRELPLLDVWTHQTDVVGDKLRSVDKRALLVVLQLRTEFMATENMDLLSAVQQQIAQLLDQAPPGLQVGITGSAAIGGDMLIAAAESIENTETYTLLLVIFILLAVYRAPLLVVIPLLAIGASVSVAMDVVAMLTQVVQLPGFEWWEFKVFKTTKIFVIVILYGAGTDYCLFLIARYKEELGRGLSRAQAVARSLGQVGHALAASALTTIVGLGTMLFADFGKFSSSGPAIAICLAFTLLSCLTLAPALLRSFGSVVFWPFGTPSPPSDHNSGDVRPPVSYVSPLRNFWEMASRMILARPGMILTVSLLVLLPVAYQGWSVDITYDLLSELERGRPSVQGTVLLRKHFPPGETGPLTVLAVKQGGDFDSKDGEKQIAHLTKFLYDIEGVTSVRSIAEPMGDRPGLTQPFSKAGLTKLAAKAHPLTKARYVAQVSDFKGNVARFDLIMAQDPFSLKAIDLLNFVDDQLIRQQADPDSPWHDATFEFIGTTAGIRDLKMVTESDRTLIQQLVVISVLAVLMLILRRPIICIYLILSVLLSYYVTIGITELAFTWLYGDTFYGLDWKVPLFLFVILIAVGEDYNIYLATRIFEEQERFGRREGLRRAIVQTGGIITSCGVIMAGTFFSMMTGTLRGMTELGFALTLGVLLDTFVVRTILVPAFFALIGRFAADKMNEVDVSSEGISFSHSPSADPVTVNHLSDL